MLYVSLELKYLLAAPLRVWCRCCWHPIEMVEDFAVSAGYHDNVVVLVTFHCDSILFIPGRPGPHCVCL